jgi:hypothetical protein
MTAEENEVIPDSIGNINDVLWFMEHSDVFKFYILGAAARFFLENKETIKKDIQLRREERIKQNIQE